MHLCTVTADSLLHAVISCRLHLKEEASEYVQPSTIRDLVIKYSQFINFNIYLWESKKETVEEPIDEDEEPIEKEEEDKPEADADDDAEVNVASVTAMAACYTLYIGSYLYTHLHAQGCNEFGMRRD